MKIVGIVGSYRKGGIIDSAIDEILLSAAEEGAETRKIYLIDSNIEFCTNCRACTQEKGDDRGKCILNDDMDVILNEVETADGLVLGSPVNAGTVTAVMKTFIERLVCYTCWPWGENAPRVRTRLRKKKAVIVASSAAPRFIARLSTNVVKLLKDTADLLGARTVGVCFIGLAAREPRQDIGHGSRAKARRLGKELVSLISKNY